MRLKWLLGIMAAMLLLAIAIRANLKPDPPKKSDPTQLALSGSQLAADGAERLEAVVAKNPDDLDTRIRLLGYYALPRNLSVDAETKARKHIDWIIQNHPDSPIAGTPYCQINYLLDADGFNEAKQLWLQQTKSHASDAAVLANAADFFQLADGDQAEKLLMQAAQLDPQNPNWHDKLGNLYLLSTFGSNGGAKKALAEFELAQAADQCGPSRYYRLDKLVKAAFDSGDPKKAAKYAQELLDDSETFPRDWNYGNAIHHANLILGRVALQNGDVKKAGEFLLKAGDTPGSPQLNSFGPNMTLAQALLEKGQKETVLKYLDECRKFWQMGGDRLDEWTKQIKKGETPNFGGNVFY